MLNVAEGYAVINVEGRAYELTPSFFNINKIGSPKEIVEACKSVGQFHIDPISGFCSALDVLEACGIDDTWLTGGIDFSEWSNKVKISQGKMPLAHVIAMAEHCIKHGITGSREQLRKADSNKESTPLTEFNTYEYVLSCVEFLGMSYDEAWGLSMTKYINLMEAKLATMRRRGDMDSNPDGDTIDLIMKQFEEAEAASKKAREAKAAASSKNKEV